MERALNAPRNRTRFVRPIAMPCRQSVRNACGGLTLALVFLAGTAAAQHSAPWSAAIGPSVVLPGVTYGSGFVLALNGRVARTIFRRSEWSFEADIRGHWGVVAGFGDCVSTSAAGCNPQVYGQLPWSLGLGPALAWRGALWSVRGALRTFMDATTGGLNHLAPPERATSFHTIQLGAAGSLDVGSLFVELEGAQLGELRGRHPNIWTLRVGRFW